MPKVNLPGRDGLMEAFDALKGGAVQLLFFGERVTTETGEGGFFVRHCWPTDSGILIDLSPGISEGSQAYVGYTLLKAYDVSGFRCAGEQAFEVEARAVEYMRCTAYMEGRSDNNMFIDFRRSERLKDGQVQYGEFNSLGQVYSRKKMPTDEPALAVRVIAQAGPS